MKNGDMPAMPHTEYDKDGNMPKGLTKREYFAVKAMQGLLASDVGMNLKEHDCVRMAVQHADALLAELAKERGDV